MILLELFWTFFKIGAFTFGGGYAMLPLIQAEVTAHGWMGAEELINFVAVSESTPGPFAVNISTFVGARLAGIPGAVCATLGVALPSFIIILLISAVLKNLLRYAGVNAFLSGVRPCVVALILATALTLALDTLLGFTSPGNGLAINGRGLIIFALLIGIRLIYKRLRGKKPSPILMIALSAGLGILLWSF